MLSLAEVQRRVKRIQLLTQGELLTQGDPETARAEERKLLFDVLWFVADESYFEGGELAREAMKLEKRPGSPRPETLT